MGSESSVGLTPQSTGPKVRTIETAPVHSDGSQPVTEMQVVVLAKRDGQTVELDLSEAFNAVLKELRTIRRYLESIVTD